MARVCSEFRDVGRFAWELASFSASERDEFNRMYGEKRFGGHGLRVLREMSQEAPQALHRFERDGCTCRETNMIGESEGLCRPENAVHLLFR